MRGQYLDKENHHPNIIRQGGKVKEVDFSAISRTYVLEGDRLKAKSIYYNDKRQQQPKMALKESEEMVAPDVQNLSDNDIYKLEYLEKMGVINEEEQQILNNIRKHMPERLNQQREQISQSRYYEEEQNEYPPQQGNNNIHPPTANNYYPPTNNYYQQNQPAQYNQGYYGSQKRPQWN